MAEINYKISITTQSWYVTEQSEPDNERYTFAYTITIKNEAAVATQLISRHWIITDANSETQEVKGLGVVGQQPVLQPGEVFEYTSGCQLETPVGTMCGSYQMVTDQGEAFEVEIPRFTLSAPRVLH